MEMDLNKEKILTELKKRKELIKNDFDVKSISLIGSFARNEQNEKSDIDFLVEFNVVSYDSLFNLMVYLEQLFSRKVDIIRLRPSLKKRSVDLMKKEMISV